MNWNLLLELGMWFFLPLWKSELQEVAPDEAKTPRRPEVEKPGQPLGDSSCLWDREIDGA
jgi:hypothetical protein